MDSREDSAVESMSNATAATAVVRMETTENGENGVCESESEEGIMGGNELLTKWEKFGK